VNRVVPGTSLLNESIALAELLATKPPLTIAAVLSAIHRGMDAAIDDGRAIEEAAFARIVPTHDAREVHTGHGLLLEKLRAFRGSPEPHDGVAEIWYESREALETLGRDPAARASRLPYEDELRFVDTARSPIWFGEEYSIMGKLGSSAAPGEFDTRTREVTARSI
jgi:EthD domain